MTSCEGSNISLPNKTGNGQTTIRFNENCRKDPSSLFTIISQIYAVVGYGINNNSQSSTINTTVKHCKDIEGPYSCWNTNFLTIIDFNTENVGLLFDKAGEIPKDSISTDVYTAEIMSYTSDLATKFFSAQVRILYKQDTVSLKRGDVLIIHSVYDPVKYQFFTAAQYQFQPGTVMQSQINKDYKSERSVNKSNRSDNRINNSYSIKKVKGFDNCYDKHYEKYNSRR
jgi:hypothetical protein